jgi:hypothetical protein
MFRIVSFCCLLASLGAIAVMTFSYVDPPVSDPLVFGFIKSDRYLPVGESISRVALYPAVQKLLADDRRAYRGILYLSGVGMLSAIGVFSSSVSRMRIVEPVSGANGHPPTP